MDYNQNNYGTNNYVQLYCKTMQSKDFVERTATEMMHLNDSDSRLDRDQIYKTNNIDKDKTNQGIQLGKFDYVENKTRMKSAAIVRSKNYNGIN